MNEDDNVLTRGVSREQLVRTWQWLDVPEGWRAEIRDGENVSEIVFRSSPGDEVHSVGVPEIRANSGRPGF